jgi:hypothetical protein
MATTYSVLGQVVPTSGNSDLYAVPSATQAVVSTIAACNTTASAATATIYIRKFSATLPAASTGNAIVYLQTIPAYSTQTFTLGITLAASDTVTVASGTSSAITYQAFGSQIS